MAFRAYMCCAAVVTGCCGSVAADVFYNALDLTGSTVTFEVSGSATGSGVLTATSGSLDAFLEGFEGNFLSFAVNAGSASFADTAFPFTVSGFPVGTVSTTDFGVSFAPSFFTLSLSSGNTYAVGGSLNFLADMGSANFADLSGQPLGSVDFFANPVSVSAPLLNTSTLSITDPDPSDGTLAVSGALKFDSVPVGDFSSGSVVIDFSISSGKTIAFEGPMNLQPPACSAWACSVSAQSGGGCALRDGVPVLAQVV